MSDTWTVKRLMNWTKKYLKKYEIDNPRIDAEYFLSEILDTSRMGVYLNYDKSLTQEELDKYRAFIKRRRDQEPIQYILNKASFMGYDFFIKKGCFITRFSTEKLVEIVLDEFEDYEGKKLRILEIGGGSGAVSISLAKLNKKFVIDIIEKEKIPQNVIEKNIEKYEVQKRVNLIKGDYFNIDLNYDYDIIISNPPYIGLKEKKDIDIEVKDYEPEESLFAGENGLNFFTEFVDYIDRYKEDALFFFEIGYNQKNDVENIFKNNGYKIKFYKDLDNVDRVIKLYK